MPGNLYRVGIHPKDAERPSSPTAAERDFESPETIVKPAASELPSGAAVRCSALLCVMNTEKRVKQLLSAIAKEKRNPGHDKKQLREWFNELWRLKDDGRCTYTGQDARFLTHTSMRTWRDDA